MIKFTQLLAPFVLLQFLSSTTRAQADSYEFELSKQKAVASARNLDGSTKSSLSGSAAQVFSPEAKLELKAPELSRLIIKTGADLLSVANKDFNRIYDFKAARMYILNEAAKTYTSESLFGILSYRIAELQNRIFLQEMMQNLLSKQKQSKTAIFDKFFSESMMALEAPQKGSGYKLDKMQVNDQIQYKHGSKTVSTLTYSNKDLPPEKNRQFSRYFIWETPLHPVLRRDLEKKGKLIKYFSCTLENPPIYNETMKLSLKNADSSEFKFDLPDGYKEEISSGHPLKKVYARLHELGYKTPDKLKESVDKYFNAAIGRKNYLDALLCMIEYGLQTGENPGEDLKIIKPYLEADPDCQLFTGGLSPPQTLEAAGLALGSLDMIDRSKHEKSYLIDIFRANLISDMQRLGAEEIKTSGENDPEKAFLNVLKVNPFITGVYNDLAQIYQRNYMQRYAWDCYDLARRFYPKHPGMLEITKRENELRRDYPQFFQGDQL